MASKLYLLALLALAGSASAMTETILNERQINTVANDILGTSHSVVKPIFDLLEECHVIFPNGAIYQVFPNNQLPAGNVRAPTAVQPFLQCGIEIRPIAVADGGTYELYSYVRSQSDNTLSLTRQKVTINVREVDWRANESDQ